MVRGSRLAWPALLFSDDGNDDVVAVMIGPKKVRELLDYDPLTGIFSLRSTGCAIGKIYHKKGYRRIYIAGKSYRASHLAWLWMTGEWPKLQIDHRNRIASDDRWENLRLATHAQNCQNRGMQSNNKSGVKGVYFDRGKWRAFIWTDGKSTFIGRFSSLDEAAEARRRVASEQHKEFANSP